MYIRNKHNLFFMMKKINYSCTQRKIWKHIRKEGIVNEKWKEDRSHENLFKPGFIQSGLNRLNQ